MVPASSAGDCRSQNWAARLHEDADSLVRGGEGTADCLDGVDRECAGCDTVAALTSSAVPSAEPAAHSLHQSAQLRVSWGQARVAWGVGHHTEGTHQ